MTFPNTSKRALELSRQIAIGKRAAAVIPEVIDIARGFEDAATNLVTMARKREQIDAEELGLALVAYVRAQIRALERVIE